MNYLRLTILFLTFKSWKKTCKKQAKKKKKKESKSFRKRVGRGLVLQSEWNRFGLYCLFLEHTKSSHGQSIFFLIRHLNLFCHFFLILMLKTWVGRQRAAFCICSLAKTVSPKTVARGISKVIPLATTWWRWSSDCLYLPPSVVLSGGDKHQLHQGSGLHDVGGGLRLRPQNHGGDRGLPWRWQLCHGETLKVQVIYIYVLFALMAF